MIFCFDSSLVLRLHTWVVVDVENCWGCFSFRTEGLAIWRGFHKTERKHIKLNGSERFEEMDSYVKHCAWTEVSISWKLHTLEFNHPEDREGNYTKQTRNRRNWNRLEDIVNHTWYFVSMLKSSFEACYIHWSLLMLRLGLVSETRNVSLPAWRFYNLEKRTNSIERSRLILLYYFLNRYSRFQILRTFGDGASFNRHRTYTWKGTEDLKRFIHKLSLDKKLDFYLSCYFIVAEESLDVCRCRTPRCLHSAYHCVIRNKRGAIWCVELVHRWVSVDLWPYTCYT